MSYPLFLTKKNTELWQQYQTLKTKTPMLFPTEGAIALGVSEFELMLASPYSHYIGNQCKAVLKQFEKFGDMESIVRNELAVHEKTAPYNNLKLGEKMGLALNVGGLDLRFFMWQWHHMLAVTDTSRADKPSYSIQFYNAEGAAIDKVYLRELSADSIARWQAMIQEQLQTVGIDELTLTAQEQPTDWRYKALSEEERAQLQQGWQEMTDVHQFHSLLKNLDIDRASSYQQAPEQMTHRLDISAVEAIFEQARDAKCPIMTFVGNSGLVQIQTGTVQTLKRMGDWFNVLDKGHNNFTLHLKDKALAQVWCVKRPTKDGIVTCIEGFDNKGSSIFSVFGQRIEGTPELVEWQQIVANIVAAHSYSEVAVQTTVTQALSTEEMV
ncbi:MAG: ChuX/HutX family heme-like substrate-binding protein [Psychrobacter sp.]|uniref:ChuX/HutX family heme-like substrate-binding protein n=1 Tax=unclassified Psychrobacter TaxID=196806 RepID=UPI0017879B56|nr:ChuX/HutX family heme-like substrate-binding protein [Psychrobacter sp. FME5]MBE0445174.1 hemin-degrading factor [Psychrobacter sp. FME5]MDN5801905.1 hemin-degrading factor [Psychrobacter sp.]MDN5898089.1 hemin-degrading factor [Psychrobacter sp.]